MPVFQIESIKTGCPQKMYTHYNTMTAFQSLDHRCQLCHESNRDHFIHLLWTLCTSKCVANV